MVNSTRLVAGLIFILGVLIQGSFVLSEDNLEPDSHRVPEKVEHGEQGSSQYNVNTVELTGNQHTKVDDEMHPPWPLRPGRRSIISIKDKNSIPTIWRPGRTVKEAKRRSSPQGSWPNKILRPGRDDISHRPPQRIFRPGREDVPESPPNLLKPGTNDVPLASREDVPQRVMLFRPGREIKRQYSKLLRPGRDDVPVANQYTLPRAGRRTIRYNMPWTYVEGSVNAHVQHKTHTFRQKAKEELAKKNEPQDF